MALLRALPARLLGLLVALLCASCLPEASSASSDGPVHAVQLDRAPHLLVSLNLPHGLRDEVPALIPVPGPWRLVATRDGVRTWEAPLPVRLRTLFFQLPPDDLGVQWQPADGRPRSLRHAIPLLTRTTSDTWSFTASSLLVRRRTLDGAPGPDEISVRYGPATERERGLNLDQSGLDAQDFALRSLQLGDANRHGLYLPAPGDATWQLTLPEGAVLDFEAAVMPPEAKLGDGSDGAELRVSVEADGAVSELLQTRLRVGDFEAQRISLARFGGRTVRLRFESLTGEDVDQDYVFIASPTVHVPMKRPPRVVVLFVDTLRRDHLGLYGYPRPTSPQIDAWSRQGAIFDQARSVAPWTLPSTRTMLTGAQPEQWKTVARLQDRFAASGWATAFFSGNVYLSSNFDMAEGWGLQRCVNWPRAEIQVDRALDFLADHADQPVFLMLHLMDAHLPYTEPLRYRFLFAGRTPDKLGFGYFIRAQVVASGAAEDDAMRQYIVDRYDNNLAYMDAQLGRMFEALSPEDRDTVVLLSDHGEEFWDHGDFEHGHTLYDELLRVPLVLRGPGIPAGRFDQPVSLLDVAPTLAVAAGVPTDDMTGWPLQELTSGARAADFAARPQAFGRPLYGARAWGSLQDGKKWIVREGVEGLWDVSLDPGETRDLHREGADTAPWRAALGAALGTEGVMGWRLWLNEPRTLGSLEVRLKVPAGVRAAWVGGDPTNQSMATLEHEGDEVAIRWGPARRYAREIFVVPEGDPVAALEGMRLWAPLGDRSPEATPLWEEGEAPMQPNGNGELLMSLRTQGRTVNLSWSATAMPFDEDSELQGFNSEVSGELQELGYLTP